MVVETMAAAATDRRTFAARTRTPGQFPQKAEGRKMTKAKRAATRLVLRTRAMPRGERRLTRTSSRVPAVARNQALRERETRRMRRKLPASLRAGETRWPIRSPCLSGLFLMPASAPRTERMLLSTKRSRSAAGV